MARRSDPRREAEAEHWYAQYGRTMLGYQSLEMSMAFLVVMDQVDSPPFESYAEAVKHLNKLYSLTIGALQRQVGKEREIPEGFADDLERARQGRNYLAHQYLVERVEELGKSSSHRREMTRALEQRQKELGEALQVITKLGRERAAEQGLDPLAARRAAERLNAEGIGFGTIRHQLNPMIAEQLDAAQKQGEPPPG